MLLLYIVGVMSSPLRVLCQMSSYQEFYSVPNRMRVVAQSEYDWASIEDRIHQHAQRTPRNHELVMGKDRELFSFSVDLKWLFSRIIDPAFWISVIRNIENKLSPFKTRPDHDCEAREIRMGIYSSIRRLSRSSVIKVFGGTLQEAQEYCLLKNRFLILYIEDKFEKQNIICRKNLANNSIGSVVNDRFVLYVGSTVHHATMRFAKSLGAKSFPYFAILHVPVSLRNGTLIKESPEVLGSLNLGKDLGPDKMLRFFAKALEFHSSALVEDKKILTKAESIGAEIIEEQTKLSLLDRGIQFFGKIGKDQ